MVISLNLPPFNAIFSFGITKRSHDTKCSEQGVQLQSFSCFPAIHTQTKQTEWAIWHMFILIFQNVLHWPKLNIQNISATSWKGNLFWMTSSFTQSTKSSVLLITRYSKHSKSSA
jgi:hypothetical protein